jgi:RNA polymerase subunit RPABC4/transcription elongation factor Spt4
MENIVATPTTTTAEVCVNCGTALGEGQAFCPNCGTPKSVPQKNLCSKCGFELQDGQAFCPNCGTPNNTPKKNVCSKCGTELKEGQEFCSNCGQKAGVEIPADVNAAINQFNTGVQQTAEKKKKTPLIIGVAVVAVLAIVLLGRGSGPNFEKLYDQYCNSTWAEVASDGSYLYIDTNPYDWEDDGLAYPEAYKAIKNVNKALGIPDSVANDMSKTTSRDGKQSETYDKVTVSWKYHPDDGLEVTYKKA